MGRTFSCNWSYQLKIDGYNRYTNDKEKAKHYKIWQQETIKDSLKAVNKMATVHPYLSITTLNGQKFSN